jgi:flavin reductase (DIM6/NTAB) family NADH-FMN oxidoreductase RutF
LTLSFYSEEYHKALQICGSKSGRDINKTKATGLTPKTLESGAITFGEARMTLDCRKLFRSPMKADDFIDKSLLERWYNDKPGGGLHDIYIVEIENIYTK